MFANHAVNATPGHVTWASTRFEVDYAEQFAWKMLPINWDWEPSCEHLQPASETLLPIRGSCLEWCCFYKRFYVILVLMGIKRLYGKTLTEAVAQLGSGRAPASSKPLFVAQLAAGIFRRRRGGVIKDLMCEWLRGKKVEKRRSWVCSGLMHPAAFFCRLLVSRMAPSATVSIGYVFALFAPTRSLNLYLRVSVNTSECGDWVGQRCPRVPVCLPSPHQLFLPSLFRLVFSYPAEFLQIQPSLQKLPSSSHQHFLPSLPPQLTRFTVSLIYWPDCILLLCSVWWIAHPDI